jgi:hypothetical protein
MTASDLDTLRLVALSLLAVVYGGALSLLVAALFCGGVYVFHRFSSCRRSSDD